MNDRELLQLAAKAAGIALLDWGDNWTDYETGRRGPAWRTQDRDLWNPLIDAGDALRLAAKLRIGMIPVDGGGWDCVRYNEDGTEQTLASTTGGVWSLCDCIVRAAAEIGRTK